MATLTVRDLDEAVVERLKTRAKQHKRSLEGEVRALLEDVARQPTMGDWLHRADRLREAGTPYRAGMPTAAELVRESRSDRGSDDPDCAAVTGSTKGPKNVKGT